MVGSAASAYFFIVSTGRDGAVCSTVTYQVDGAMGSGLVLALLGEEQETLAGLACPGGEVVVLQESGDLLRVDRLGAEPEELLAVNEIPRSSILASDCL